MPLSLSERNPSLVDKVNEAYERARALQGGAARDLGGVSLLDAMQADGDAAREQGVGASSGLEVIRTPETRAAFERSFELSGKMAGYIDLPTPSPEDMAESGVNFAYLDEQYERMKAAGEEPHIVLTPHGLGLDNWRTIYAKATADVTIPNNPLQAHNDGHGLCVSDDAVANWHTFDKAPSHTTTPGQTELPSVVTTTSDGTAVTWTIRITPGKQKPDNLNADYNGVTKDANGQLVPPAVPPTHQTTPEMLTDKLTAIMAGETPSDKSHYSWCDNGQSSRQVVAGGSAPRGDWFSVGGRVFVDWGDVGFRYGRLGSRSPVG